MKGALADRRAAGTTQLPFAPAVDAAPELR